MALIADQAAVQSTFNNLVKSEYTSRSAADVILHIFETTERNINDYRRIEKQN